MSILHTYRETLETLLPNPTAVDLDAPADITKPFAPQAVTEADRRILARSTWAFLAKGDLDEDSWDFLVEEARRIEVAVATLARIGGDLDAALGLALSLEPGEEITVQTLLAKANRIGSRESSIRPDFGG